MKGLLLFCLIGITCLSSNAQTFNKRCINNAYTTQFSAIQSRNDTLLVVGEGQWIDSPYAQKVCYSVYDDTGAIISTQRLIVDTQINYFSGRCFIKTFNNEKAFVGFNNKQGFLAITNNADSIIRIYTFSDSTAIYLTFSHVIQLRDSSFLLTGIYQGSNYVIKGLLIRIDKNGTEIWRKYIGSGSDDQAASYMMQSNNGRLLVFMDRFQSASLPLTTFWVKSIIYQLDTIGNILQTWIKADSTFGPFNVVPTSKGYIIATQKESYYDSSNSVITQGYFAELDTDFNPIWEHAIGRPSFLTAFYNCKKLSDNNYLAIGSVYDSSASPNHLVESGWIMKFTESGTILWTRNYVGVDSNGATNEPDDFVELSDGSLAICGHSNNPFVPSFGYQGWLLRLDTCGCLVPGCQTHLGISEVGTAGVEFKVYPNPGHAQCYIYFKSTDEDRLYDLKIVDMNGREINGISHLKSDVTYLLNTSNYASGTFLITLYEKNIPAKTIKMVLN